MKYQMHASIEQFPLIEVKRCDRSTATGLGRLLPEKDKFDVGSRVEVRCPAGYGVNGSYNSLVCEYDRNLLRPVWSPSIPSCSVSKTEKFYYSLVYTLCATSEPVLAA